MSRLKILLISAGICIGLAGCMGGVSEAVASDERAIVEAFYTELLSKAARDDLDVVAAKVLVEKWVSVPTPRGGPDRAGFVASLQGFAKAVPDLNWVPQEILQDGSRFTVRSTATGTPVLPFLGVEPKGNSFEIMTIDIHTVANGKIVSSYHVEDWATAMRQLSSQQRRCPGRCGNQEAPAMRRRIFLSSTAAGTALASLHRIAFGKLSPTPWDYEGPFYPTVPVPIRSDLLNATAQPATGTALALSGAVRDESGQPLPGARVEIWQCDARGRYRHPHAPGHAEVDPGFSGFGAVKTAVAGRYEFLTLMPVPYTGRPPHIHFKLFVDGEQRLVTQLYLKGKSTESSAFLNLFASGRSALEIDPVESGGQMRATFDFVV